MTKRDVLDLVLDKLDRHIEDSERYREQAQKDVHELKQLIAGYQGALTVIKWVGGTALTVISGWAMVLSRKVGLIAF